MKPIKPVKATPLPRIVDFPTPGIPKKQGPSAQAIARANPNASFKRAGVPMTPVQKAPKVKTPRLGKIGGTAGIGRGRALGRKRRMTPTL